jgi:hypothetical protein
MGAIALRASLSANGSEVVSETSAVVFSGLVIIVLFLSSYELRVFRRAVPSITRALCRKVSLPVGEENFFEKKAVFGKEKGKGREEKGEEGKRGEKTGLSHSIHKL